MTYWETISRHWRKSVERKEIIRQIMEHAQAYPAKCASCQRGEPTNKNRLIKPNYIRACMKPEDLEPFIPADQCPSFKRHSALRLWRVSSTAEWTQKAMSKLTGVPLPTIKSHEGGMRNMSWKTAIKYAELLGCNPQDLL